jgi:1-acyl-sn-glycerol-3-phosphate acyltransferase
MLDFCDKPYRFIPARRSAWLTWLCSQVNRRWHLPRHHQVLDVAIEGHDQLLAEQRPGDRLVFMPNHPTHSDPQIMLESLRQLGIATEFMAAYDVFHRSRLAAYCLSRCGAFSVDREGLDAQALRHAHQTLLAGKHALTIFPEGNVFLQNDLLAPFNEGAAFLALKAARELDRSKGRVLVVPVAIKATFIEDIRNAVFDHVRRLAGAIEVTLSENCPLAWLRRIGHEALRRNQRTRGLTISLGGDPKSIIHRAVEEVLDRLELKVGLKKVESNSLLERICRVRRAIHQVRIDESRKADHSAAAVWADEAMMAFKVASYVGNYVHRRPTLDRYAETVQKLDEDIHSQMPAPLGPRYALVSFGSPIDLTDRVEQNGKLRQAAQRLTADCERAVQQELDRLAEENQRPGAQLVAEPHTAEVLVEA